MGKGYSSREIIKVLKADGWALDHATGSHHIFVHPTKRGTVTVPHPKNSLKKGTQKSIFKQAQLEEP